MTTPAHQRARAVVEQLTMEPTKGSFQADADEWAAKCKTTDELVALIENAIAAALEEEIEACATYIEGIVNEHMARDSANLTATNTTESMKQWQKTGLHDFCEDFGCSSLMEIAAAIRRRKDTV